MKILFVQDHVHLPGLGGAIKANRLMLESLAARGHRCHMVTPALTTKAGPETREQFAADRGSRGVRLEYPGRHVYRYRFRDVLVDATDFPTAKETRNYIHRRIEETQPDWVLVDDDKRRTGLAPALAAAPGRVLVVLQTVANLPFGPFAARPDPAQTERMRAARGILVISRFLKGYAADHAGLDSTLVRLPVYGAGPFPVTARFGSGFVLLVNPCTEKGLDIFLALARALPGVPFAAVPTWGADEHVLKLLAGASNIELVTPAEDIGEIMRRANILIAPSLWPETFGYVVPEAMLRGLPAVVSNVGGLPEAGLGAATVLNVAPLVRMNGGYRRRKQDVEPWIREVSRLREQREHYEQRSAAAHRSATRFAAGASSTVIERHLEALAERR